MSGVFAALDNRIDGRIEAVLEARANILGLHRKIIRLPRYLAPLSAPGFLTELLGTNIGGIPLATLLPCGPVPASIGVVPNRRVSVSALVLNRLPSSNRCAVRAICRPLSLIG